jgi:hypothetical protein
MAVLLGAVKGRKGKVRISFIDSNGYKVFRYVTPLELKVMAKVINYTIE